MHDAPSAPWSWLDPPAPHHARYRAAGLWDDRTVADSARDIALRDPDQIPFPGLSPACSIATILSDAEALCGAMRGLGLRPGDVVSFQTPNWIEAAVINLAAALGGFVVNPIVIIYRDAEVRGMLAEGRARLLFIAEAFRGHDFTAMVDRIRGDLPHLIHVAFVRSARPGSYEEMLASGRGAPHRAARVDPDGVKMLLYTSGTTGRPKGVLHSHNTLARAVTVAARHWAVRDGDAMLMPSPVTHISGYANGLEMPFLVGTRTVLMESWNAQDALGLIERHAVVGTVAATPFLQELAIEARGQGRDLPSLRFFACGGAAVPPSIIHDANAAFARCAAFRVYGSSEAPLVTLGWPSPADRALAAGTDGEIRDYEVRIVGEDGRSRADGQDGEILARGPAMFMGYADQGQTAEALTQDGFFRTGDIGCRTPEGAILITDRKKDLIIRGGENISAKEIEDVLIAHPGVSDVAVVAMPHPRLGEGICAYVVPADGVAIDPPALAAMLAAAGLAKQKTPERFEFIDALPRTASGKVRKDVLRAAIRTLVSDESGC